MAGTLYTYPNNFRAYKILIAAQYSGEDIRVVSEPPEFVLGETNKTAEFLEKFPLGKVPAFETAEGIAIYETNAIAYYVAGEQLHGKTKIEAVQIQQFVNVADQEILPSACTWVFPTYGIIQFNKQNTDKAKEDIRTILGVLNKHLETRTFLVGERVTLADIAVACTLLMLYQQVLEPAFRAPFGNVNRWFTTCINQPQFLAVIGKVELCTKMAQFDANKFAELQPKKDVKKKDKEDKKAAKEEKKAAKEAKQAAKEAKQAAKKDRKAKDDEDEDDEDAPREASSKDPFADLPKSPFVFDEFKRCYSNKDTLTEAIPFFWEKFDPEGYSIWYSEYKYPEELKRIFMSCNLVGGMFQRLDKLHKNAFASVIIFGEDNNNSISGIWVFRGHQLAFELNENWQIDSPSYNWTRLDPSNEEHRKMINEYFAWEGDFGGKTMNQGKIFK